MKPTPKSRPERERYGSERRSPTRRVPTMLVKRAGSETGAPAAAGLWRASRRHRIRLRRRHRERNPRRPHGAFCHLLARRSRRRTAHRHNGSSKRKNPPRCWAPRLEFIELDGDAHLEVRAAHAIKLAGIIRRVRPGIVLAPSLVENQHPDHPRLGQLVRDACRLARYGGVKELRRAPPHAIEQLFYYAVTPEAEPPDITPVFIDVSAPEILKAWTVAMEAHASQAAARNYVELQLTRARLRGLRAGVGHAIALFPNDPLVLDSLRTAAAARGGFKLNHG